MSRKRRNFSPCFKAKVALESVQGLRTISELAQKHKLHPTQINLWRKQLLDGAVLIFENGKSVAKACTDEPQTAELYEQIGRLNIQVERLKKEWPRTVREARVWIDFDNQQLSIREQCRLLGLHRSNVYYDPAPESAQNLHLMRLMDEEYLRRPNRGSRQMVDFLSDEGHDVNRKRMQRLMRKMGIEGVAPKPRTTAAAAVNPVYPYLLRNLEVLRPDQVWCSDITYIPMQFGFLYLVAVMDWFSRYVISWRLSNSLDAEFCIEALEDALRQERPEIFNTDQGAQFTSGEFTGVLKSQDVAISLDGKGRAIDNVMIERLWRTVKYEEVYLKAYVCGADCYQGLDKYLDYNAHQHRHQSLARRTPWEVYRPNRVNRLQHSI